MKNAFTLVELAIVIVIIGLLVGGVLQGQELINQAKIRQNIKKLHEINAAITTFYAKYNNLPGDMTGAKANSVFGYGSNSFGGNGDNILCSHATCLGGSSTTSDSHFSFLHLTSAKLLNPTKGNGDPFTLANQLTSTGIGNIYARFRTDRGGDNSYNFTGAMMLISGDFAKLYHNNSTGIDVGNVISISTVATSGQHMLASFTADETRTMDEKMDDGNALTGKFKGANATSAPVNCHASGVYLNNEKDMSCRLLVDMNIN